VDRLRACDDGSPKACYRLGLKGLERGKTPEHRRRAVNYLRKSCQGGHGPACLKLKALYESACSSGTGVACFAAGQLYHQGRTGIVRDLKKALHFYKAARKNGYRGGRQAFRNVRREIKTQERIAKRARAAAEKKARLERKAKERAERKRRREEKLAKERAEKKRRREEARRKKKMRRKKKRRKKKRRRKRRRRSR
jgi:TPR repeat protein